jgi:ribokinase
MLQIGRERGAFNVSSFVANEAAAFEKAGGVALSDQIAINIDEAAAHTGDIFNNKIKIANRAAERILNSNPNIKLIVTEGSDGSFAFEDGKSLHIPCGEAKPVNTAGAGDAYLGGTAAGIINGLSFADAARFGNEVARVAVMSEDTIAWNVTRELFDDFTV